PLTAIPRISLFSHLSYFYTAPLSTDPSTLSLHDALPIYSSITSPDGTNSSSNPQVGSNSSINNQTPSAGTPQQSPRSGSRPNSTDRKSTRLNSSHVSISYAVFCLKKKKIHYSTQRIIL